MIESIFSWNGWDALGVTSSIIISFSSLIVAIITLYISLPPKIQAELKKNKSDAVVSVPVDDSAVMPKDSSVAKQKNNANIYRYIGVAVSLILFTIAVIFTSLSISSLFPKDNEDHSYLDVPASCTDEDNPPEKIDTMDGMSYTPSKGIIALLVYRCRPLYRELVNGFSTVEKAQKYEPSVYTKDQVKSPDKVIFSENTSDDSDGIGSLFPVTVGSSLNLSGQKFADEVPVDHNISAVDIPPHVIVHLYTDKNFTGQQITFVNNRSTNWHVDLTDYAFDNYFDWNDKTSSIKVQLAKER